MAKKMDPHGKVVNGKFKGLNVYVWVENESLAIIEGILSNGFFAAPYTKKLIVNATEIEAYEDLGGISHHADPGKVGLATFWFGAGAGIIASQLGNQTVYTVVVQYRGGGMSQLQLDSWAYQNFKSIVFNISQGIKKENNNPLSADKSITNVGVYAQQPTA